MQCVAVKTWGISKKKISGAVGNLEKSLSQISFVGEWKKIKK